MRLNRVNQRLINSWKKYYKSNSPLSEAKWDSSQGVKIVMMLCSQYGHVALPRAYTQLNGMRGRFVNGWKTLVL